MPILATKLFTPPPPAQLVSRPRLLRRLNEGLQASGGFAKKLTLVSAPAGFGKSTLVSTWCATLKATDPHRMRTAWLSLDEADNDPVRFFIYLVAALQTISPEIGQGVAGALQAPQPPPVETLLTVLVNEITRTLYDIVLVLDDYHVVDSEPVDQALTFLLEHLPPQMHLVITTREDPPLPLPRLRARGQLTEVRAADLRFTPSEAAEFLNSVMGLNLSAPDITALEDRTEGWIAGLQLAALSMRGNEDVPGFVRAFTGDHRYIVDYLVAEVLQQQPEAMRQFLLQTSILERMNGSLCEAVTGQTGGSARLGALERGNFFVVPLDDRRQWHRYHHLFAQVLFARLKTENPELVRILHQRASEWYEQNGFVEDAIRHAFNAEDLERAADLVELAWPDVHKSRRDAMMHGWLKALPDELLYYRPVLSAAYAHVLLAGGVLEGVEERLKEAEQWLDPTFAETHSEPGRGMVVVDAVAFRRLSGAIAVARVGLTLARGDVPASVLCARRALELAPEDDYFTRGGAAGFLGLAAWMSGDLAQANRMYADGMASLQRAGNIADAVNGAVTLGAIQIAQGRLREAMRTYERGLQLATEQGTRALVVRGAGDMYVGMSELEYEHNQLQVATQHLLTSKELGELAGFPQNRYRWCIAMARIRQAQGDWDDALVLLHEAERLFMSDFSPNVRPIAALMACVWIAQGKLGQALGWAHEQGLSAGDELSYEHEFEHITLARLMLAQYKSNPSETLICETTGLLERLLKAAEPGGRMGNVIAVLVLQALAHHAGGDFSAALIPLERALALAEPEGYVRLFLDEGANMAQLLRRAVTRETMRTYASKLLVAFSMEQTKNKEESSPHPSVATQSLPEPLTERELEILRLFKTELSGPEIADKLIIALSTLRTHTKSIYSKLGVNSRRAAVNRAEDLHLI